MAKSIFLFLYQKYGNACLGILNGSDVGLKDLNIVGGRKSRQNLINQFQKHMTHITDIYFHLLADVTMQDQMVIYDNERGQIGWIRAPCDRIPKFGSSLL